MNLASQAAAPSQVQVSIGNFQTAVSSEHVWAVEKSVDNATLSIGIGELPRTVTFTIRVSKAPRSEFKHYVAGRITVVNVGKGPTEVGAAPVKSSLEGALFVLCASRLGSSVGRALCPGRAPRLSVASVPALPETLNPHTHRGDPFAAAMSRQPSPAQTNALTRATTPPAPLTLPARSLPSQSRPTRPRSLQSAPAASSGSPSPSAPVRPSSARST
jgi:hypothetical protein